MRAEGREVDEEARAKIDEHDILRACGTGALRCFLWSVRARNWWSAWDFFCSRAEYERAVSLHEPRLQTTHDPILDARAFYRRNSERMPEEVAVLLERLGWSADVAMSAARVAFKERR